MGKRGGGRRKGEGREREKSAGGMEKHANK